MPRRITLYIAAVAAAASSVLFALFTTQPELVSTQLYAALGLALFGVFADFLEYQLPGGGAASIANIPFLAVGLVAPNWGGVAAVGLAMALGQLVHRRAPVKAVFNVAQVVLSVGLGVVAYRLLGGLPLERLNALAQLSASNVAAAIALIVAFVLVNSFTVAGIIARTQDASTLAVWKRNTLSTFVYSIFTAPLAFGLAWVYVRSGPFGAALIALPLIGVRQLYQTTLRHQKTNVELLELMVKAIEARDPYTSGHSRRVSDAATVIARSIGLRPRQVERVRVAALLHDIGKIHSDFAGILQKEGKLTDEEWSVMKTHPDKGADLVATLSDLQDIVAPVRHHHEHWNGRGYPAGLAGEAIPLAARIITFADTIDALMTDRPYRRGKTAAEVREELLRCSGSQFDPSICARVLSPEVWSQLFADRPASGAHLSLVKRAVSSKRRVAV